MLGQTKEIADRLSDLENHLRDENPLLVDVIRSYRQLDTLARRIGFIDRDQSYAAMIPWWPLISILGTFSAGKSTFINHYLRKDLQQTGNQAVDDKFSVICYSNNADTRVLPGVALDADPRFPFFNFSEQLEKVSSGEGDRVDAYLQLKTCDSELLRGNIIIDSPGFDADSQRTSTLKITDYIIELSDLVLVFFDARHPEPGAMQDTLTHLVGGTIKRHDSNKFLHILNQIDTTAREDNPEDVVGAWQRALAQEGLTAGKFYTIYNKQAANPIDDPALRERYERKCDEDLQAIHKRMEQVRVERAYRIIKSLEKTARNIKDVQMPHLKQLSTNWIRGTLWRDGFIWMLILGGSLFTTINMNYWNGFDLTIPGLDRVLASTAGTVFAGFLVFALVILIHSLARRWAAASTLRGLRKRARDDTEFENLRRALLKNTRWWRSVFRPNPVGWNRRVNRKLDAIIAAADTHIQSLNNRFTSPSGNALDQQHTSNVGEHDNDSPALPVDYVPTTDAEIAQQARI